MRMTRLVILIAALALVGDTARAAEGDSCEQLGLIPSDVAAGSPARQKGCRVLCDGETAATGVCGPVALSDAVIGSTVQVYSEDSCVYSGLTVETAHWPSASATQIWSTLGTLSNANTQVRIPERVSAIRVNKAAGAMASCGSTGLRVTISEFTK